MTRIAGLIAITVLSVELSGAQERPKDARVFLQYLPQRARVYLDQKPARFIEPATIAAPAGNHVLQIEWQSTTGLQAMRRILEVSAGQRAAIPMEFRPVILPSHQRGRDYYWPMGMPGPRGRPGPPALPARPLPDSTDLLVLSELLAPAIDILNDDLIGEIEMLQNRLYGYQRAAFLYAPRGVEFGPFGTSGPQGQPGRAGLPTEAFQLQTENGERVLDVLQRKRTWDTLRRHLVDIGSTIDRIVGMGGFAADNPPTIQILTDVWRKPLDEDFLKTRTHRAPETMVSELPDIMGPPGARGPRGPDGKLQNGGKILKLSDDDVCKLSTMLFNLGSSRDSALRLSRALGELQRRLGIADSDKRFRERKGIPQSAGSGRERG